MDKIENHHYSDERDKRVKETGEVFTPDALIQKMLNGTGYDWDNHNHSKTWIDPTCGSGNFLVALAKRGIQIQNLFGVDLMQDNTETTKRRLTEIYGDSENTTFHLNRNIVCADALTYHYDFFEHDDLLNDEW